MELEFQGVAFQASGGANEDLSITMGDGHGSRAWYVDFMKLQVVRANGFLGSVAEGGAVNFRDVQFNPHGNGTHTECLGHISPEAHSVNELSALGWWQQHAFIPFAPWRCAPRGAVPRKDGGEARDVR